MSFILGSAAATIINKLPITSVRVNDSWKNTTPKAIPNIISRSPTILATLGSEYLKPKITKKKAHKEAIAYPSTPSQAMLIVINTQLSPKTLDRIKWDTKMMPQVKILSCNGE